MANFNIPLRILTLNVQGLRKVKKRQALFRMFKLMKIDIVSLQETYLVAEDVEVIEREWKDIFHISPGTKHSKGLLTLFNSSLNNLKITKLLSKNRVLVSSLSVNNESLIISNVYAPCDNLNNRISFFMDLENTLMSVVDKYEASLENLIVLGDFNTCLENELDIISGNHHPEALKMGRNPLQLR